MNISNLNELLNTQIINEGSILSVEGFALDLNDVKPAFAFFSNDEKEIEIAVEKGAYAVISEKKLVLKDKEVYFLKSQNLEHSLLRLLRFLCEEKNLSFLFCSKQEFKMSKIFNLKSLQGKVFLDFALLNKAKKDEIFCFIDENYLLQLCASVEKLKETNLKQISHSSPFYSSFVCRDLYFKNLKFPFVYAAIFARFISFLQDKNLKIQFDLNKWELCRIYFLDFFMQIVEFGTSSRAFILCDDEDEFEILRAYFSVFKGFKTARKNSLFCDFSYEKISDLRQIKDFKYVLVLLENMENFEEEWVLKQRQEQVLFKI